MGGCCSKTAESSSWLAPEEVSRQSGRRYDLFDDWERAITIYETAERDFLALHTDAELTEVLNGRQQGGIDLKGGIDLREAHRQVQHAEAAFKNVAGDLNDIEVDGKLSGEQPQSEVKEEDSKGLSHTLVCRLKAVSTAQGTIVSGKIKEKWPEWLVDESFEVVKVRLGVKYRRTLKLTQYHILAASSDKGVTKVYPYLDLCDVRVSQREHEESVTLVFRHKDQTDSASEARVFYEYLTPMAAIIAQQISTRLRIRKALRPAGGSASGRCSSQSDLAGMAGASNAVLLHITNENRKSKTSAILAFAEALAEKLPPNAGETSLGGARKSVPNPNRDSVLSSGRDSQGGRSSKVAKASKSMGVESLQHQ